MMTCRTFPVGPAARDGSSRVIYSVRLPALACDLLDAGDQLVDRLLDRHLVVDDAAHRLGPDVLVVENCELVVPGELEAHCAVGELIAHRLAMLVAIPECGLLPFQGHREPAAERTLDIGRQVLVLQQESDE